MRVFWASALAAVMLGGMVSESRAAGPSCGTPGLINVWPLRGSRGSSVLERNDIIGTDGYVCYRINLTGPGTLTLILYSAQDQAYFRLYGPGWDIGRSDGNYVFKGSTLPGAGVDDNARRWKGPIPQTNILMVIGSKGDARRYRLRVMLQ
jgi:hypothetical protein